jgi:hypothetical protein
MIADLYLCTFGISPPKERPQDTCPGRTSGYNATAVKQINKCLVGKRIQVRIGNAPLATALQNKRR